MHPDLANIANEPDKLVSDGRLTVPILHIWNHADVNTCGSPPVDLPAARRVDRHARLHRLPPRADAPRDRRAGPGSRSQNLPLCVDDDAVPDCSVHVVSNKVGLTNTDPRSRARLPHRDHGLGRHATDGQLIHATPGAHRHPRRRRPRAARRIVRPDQPAPGELRRHPARSRTGTCATRRRPVWLRTCSRSTSTSRSVRPGAGRRPWSRTSTVVGSRSGTRATSSRTRSTSSRTRAGPSRLNYRLVGNSGSGATNGVYPAAEQDVAAGIAYLANHAAQNQINRSRIMLLGHSAGAFLVSAVSTDASFLAGAGSACRDVVCTVPLDTTYDIPTQIAAGGTSEAMYRVAFGNDPAVMESGVTEPERRGREGHPVVPHREDARGLAESRRRSASLRYCAAQCRGEGGGAGRGRIDARAGERRRRSSRRHDRHAAAHGLLPRPASEARIPFPPRSVRSGCVRAEAPDEPLGVPHGVVAGAVVLIGQREHDFGARRHGARVMGVGIVDDDVDRARSGSKASGRPSPDPRGR